MQIFKCLSCSTMKKLETEDLKLCITCPRCRTDMYRIVPRMKLGEVLLSFNWISEEELEQALNIQKQLKTDYPLGRVLKIIGKINQSVLNNALEFQRNEFEEKTI